MVFTSLNMSTDGIRAKLDWTQSIPSKDKQSYSVKNIVISPDGEIFIASLKNRVLLCKIKDGTIVESLLGHKEIIKSLTFSFDGEYFSSGGLDNVVVIWKRNGEGLLKYTHSSPVQLVSFSPNSLLLISCAETDFGIWSPDQKQVIKEKIESRATAICWSLNGAFFALGFENGEVSIRVQTGEETLRFSRGDSVQCLQFLSSDAFRPSNQSDQYVVVGCWDKTISLYHIQDNTVKVLYERVLPGYPLCICLAGFRQDSFIVSMSTGTVNLFSKEGVKISNLVTKETWIWSHAYESSSEYFLVGTDNGVVERYNLKYGSVDSLCFERFAYRENLTEIIIQNLVTNKKVRIKCKDLVLSITLHQNKVAIQLSDKVCVYECGVGDETDMHYRLRKDKITAKSDDVERVLLTNSHLILFKAAVIELYTFECNRCHVWQLESPVKCVCTGGGSDGSESFYIGCVDGSIMRFFVNNAFLTEIGKCQNSLIGIDRSFDGTKLACVDESGLLTVIEIKSQQVVYAANGVSTAYFNSQIDDMLCFCSGCGIDSQCVRIVICPSVGSSTDSESKTTGIIPQEVDVIGRVIGLRGRQILSQSDGALIFTEISQSANIALAAHHGNFSLAYQLVCLAGTESDWRNLAMKALRANELDVAKKCFARLKDVKFLMFVDWISKGHTTATGSNLGSSGRHLTTPDSLLLSSSLDPVWQAELLAIENLPLEAAKAYNRMGRPQEAIRVLTDLRLYAEAKTFAQNTGFNTAAQSELVSQHAEWLEETSDWRGAADLYISLGFLLRGAKLIGTHELPGWDCKLLELIKDAHINTNELLGYCAEKFTSTGKLEYAMEAYKKLGDVSRLIELYAARKMWKEATDLAERNPGKFDPVLFVPHAHWLVANARYEEAISTFIRAGRSYLGFTTLTQLLMTSVHSSDFKLASYYSWKIARHIDDTNCGGSIDEWELKSNIYYAYATIQLSSRTESNLSKGHGYHYFQASLYILNLLSVLRNQYGDVAISGVSEALVLFVLGREAIALGAYKLAHYVYDRLSLFRASIRSEEDDEIEFNTMRLLTKPLTDNRELLPICYRCGSTNPLLNPSTGKRAGDCCSQCGHTFIRSFSRFEILPLVEFIPQQGISDERAIELITQSLTNVDLPDQNEGKSNYGNRIRTADARFRQCLDRNIDSQVQSGSDDDAGTSAVIVDESTLQEMKRNEVYVCKPIGKRQNRYTFYKMMEGEPTIGIALSQPCYRFFREEDFESEYLSKKKCPFSNVKDVGDYGSL